MEHAADYSLLTNLSVILVVAFVFGLTAKRLGLSPLLGYLLAGIALGPMTPGFVADPAMAFVFAEIGVILLMFGVGLHFRISELLAVRKIALPGAISLIVVVTLLGMGASLHFGRGYGTGIVIGFAVSVASTVVLLRVLMDNQLIHTEHGHIAVGWLIVEDIMTVLFLVLLPAMAGFFNGGDSTASSLFQGLGIALLKFGALVLIVLVVGVRLVPHLLHYVARVRSRELFTLAVFALALAIATSSAQFFGVSMALGAFLAGITVGQSQVSHQAAADALPMRDAFAVLFFVSVGMLFDPRILLDEAGFIAGLLFIILLAKPIATFVFIWFKSYPARTGLIVGLARAQIGEFSFILAEGARQAGILALEDYSVIVACSVVSIAINPFLFRTAEPLEQRLRQTTCLRQLFERRMSRRSSTGEILETLPAMPSGGAKAIVVGYGPVGRTVAQILRNVSIPFVVIDLNLDTIQTLRKEGTAAIYGDASQREILERAGIEGAAYLVLTIPDLLAKTTIVVSARELNSEMKILVRGRYLPEGVWFKEVGATETRSEEEEVAVSLAELLLSEIGARPDDIHQEVVRVREELQARKSSNKDR